MKVNNKQYSWGHLANRFFIVLLVIVPFINTLAAIITDLIFGNQTATDKNYFYFSVWAWSLIWYSWTLALFILVPFCLLYSKVRIVRKSITLQIISFYLILAVSGYFLKDGVIIGIYTSNQYPRVYILYLVITLSLVPICDFQLKTWKQA